MTTQDRLGKLYLRSQELTEEEQKEYLTLQLQYEKGAELPMSSFIDYDLKRKLRHREKLTKLEVSKLVEGFNRLNSLAGRVSEKCVATY